MGVAEKIARLLAHLASGIAEHSIRWGSADMIKERGWERFATYSDELAAKVVVDYLHRHACPAQVGGSAGANIDSGVHVLVPGELLHRARWLWAQADLSEQELNFLASGELPGGEGPGGE